MLLLSVKSWLYVCLYSLLFLLLKALLYDCITLCCFWKCIKLKCMNRYKINEMEISHLFHTCSFFVFLGLLILALNPKWSFMLSVYSKVRETNIKLSVMENKFWFKKKTTMIFTFQNDWKMKVFSCFCLWNTPRQKWHLFTLLIILDKILISF